MYTFGTGYLFGLMPDGSAIQFGTLQDVSVSVGYGLKLLYGQNQHPVAAARAAADNKGSAAFADIKADALNMLLGGEPVIEKGRQRMKRDFVGLDSTAKGQVDTTHDILVALGIFYVGEGNIQVPLKNVYPSTPLNEDEISFNKSTGVVEAHISYANKTILIQHMVQLDTGKTVNVVNHLMAAAPTFQMYLENLYGAKVSLGLRLYSCISGSFDFSFAREDFTIPKFDFTFMADTRDRVMQVFIDE